MKLRAIVFAAVVGIAASMAVPIQVLAQGTHKDEMGLTRMRADYPVPGSEIDRAMPEIAADASGLEYPLDTNTVTATLDGIDVTASAEVTPSYVIYTPDQPLAAGPHEFRVTAKDVNKKDVEPLTWTFTVKGGAVVTKKPGDNTTGRLSLSTDYISAEYVPQANIEVSNLFREKEGMKLNADFSFVNTSDGRVLSGAFHRETQQYTDIELDKGRLNYTDSKCSAAVGNFWYKMSDLTVGGTELAGLRVERGWGRWEASFFTGRTQDPSTSGTFRQDSYGADAAYNWDDSNRTTIMAVKAKEKPDAVRGLTATHASDEILALMHEYKKGEKLKIVLEAAGNHRLSLGCAGGCAGNAAVRDGDFRDEAYRAGAAWRGKAVNASAEIYRIGANYFPVAEGGTKLLRNDRNGARAGGSWRIFKMLTAGAEYEQYETDSTSFETKRGRAFVTVGDIAKSAATYSKGKLASGGTVSETDGVTAFVRLPEFLKMRNMLVSFGWQKADFAAAAVLSETKTGQVSLTGSFGNRFSASAGYSKSENVSASFSAAGALTGSSAVDNKRMYAGFTWDAAPRKLSLDARYEVSEADGTNVDTREKTARAGLVYQAGLDYEINIAYEHITYADGKSSLVNYTQDILRAGVVKRF